MIGTKITMKLQKHVTRDDVLDRLDYDLFYSLLSFSFLLWNGWKQSRVVNNDGWGLRRAVYLTLHIGAETKWTPFHRRHFLEKKIWIPIEISLKFGSN